MTDDQIKAAFSKVVERVRALEERIADLEAAPSKSTRKPRDIAEVCAYFKSHGLNGTAQHEAERFWNFYDSKGWKVGKTPMVRWRGAAANWIDGKVEVEGTKPRKPQANVDFYLRDDGTGTFVRCWIRNGERTNEVFKESHWREEAGIR